MIFRKKNPKEKTVEGDERVQRPGPRVIDGVASPCLDAWELYKQTFKDGDEIVLIEDDGGAYYGTIINTNDYGVKVKLISGETCRFDFDVIRFMGQAGFPVRKLLGADGSSSIDKAHRKGTSMALRRALAKETRVSLFDYTTRREAGSESEKLRPPRPRRSFGYSDPFVVENVYAELHNPGKVWIPKWFWRPEHYDYEEVLSLEAQDGARALLWDIPSIHHFEIEQGDGEIVSMGVWNE